MWRAIRRNWIVTVSFGEFTGVPVGKGPMQTQVLLTHLSKRDWEMVTAELTTISVFNCAPQIGRSN